MLHALAHRINTRIEGLHGVVDDHTALAIETDLLRKLHIGPDALRHYHQIRVDLAAILETHTAHALFAEDGGGLRLQQIFEAALFERALEQRRGGLVELALHHAVEQVHDGDFHALLQQTNGGLEPQKTAADVDRAEIMFARGEHGMDVVDVAKAHHDGQLMARHGDN